MILRRLILIVFILFAIISMTYGMMSFAGGTALTSERGISDKKLQEEQLRQYKEKHNYTLYLQNIIKGNLGTNNKDIPINDIVSSAIPVSFFFGFIAVIAALAIGVTAGIIGAYYQNHWPDRLAMLLALIGLSVPAFTFGPLLQMSFGVKWDILPLAMWWHPFSEYATGSFANLILPTITVASIPAATIARITRSSMLEAISQDYMRTALSKGLGQFSAIVRHGLKNACLPVLSYLGPAAASILMGSIVVEKIFVIPGLGTLFINGALDRDIELVLSIVLLYSTLLLFFNLLVDFLYGVIDPRIKAL